MTKSRSFQDGQSVATATIDSDKKSMLIRVDHFPTPGYDHTGAVTSLQRLAVAWLRGEVMDPDTYNIRTDITFNH